MLNRRGFLSTLCKSAVLGAALAFPVSKLAVAGEDARMREEILAFRDAFLRHVDRDMWEPIDTGYTYSTGVLPYECTEQAYHHV